MDIIRAFDVYGTLIDTHGLVARITEFAGNGAAEFSRIWRDKQLEYSFRRGLLQHCETFAVCTWQALDYSCSVCRLPLPTGQKEELLLRYRTLPPFPDVPAGLAILQGGGAGAVIR